MNLISIPIFIFCGAALFLCAYFILMYFKIKKTRIFIISALICFIYLIYNILRIGIYNTIDGFWNYLFMYVMFSFIPLLAIVIIIFIKIYFKPVLDDHKNILFMINIGYIILFFAIIIEAIVLMDTRESYIAYSHLYNLNTTLTVSKGIAVRILFVYLIVTSTYIYIKLIYWNIIKKNPVPLINKIFLSLFFFSIIHDILIFLKFIPYYTYLFEYTSFFLLIIMTNTIINNTSFFKAASEIDSLDDDKKTNYAVDYLLNVDVSDIENKLNKEMEEHKVYRDPYISLKSLSEKISTSSRIISQFLNEKRGIDFRNFINAYRIEEAKQLLEAEKESSIISICFNVGFQSFSSFNRAFKKYVGTSPNEYKKKFIHSTASGS